MNAFAKSLALAAVAAGAPLAHAGIVNFDPTKADEITAPADMKYKGDSYQTPLMQVWNEQQGGTLAAPLSVDAQADGVYESQASLVGATLPAGTAFSSQYLFFDPAQSANLVTTVTFDAPILGVIVTDGHLFGSDGLALPTVPAANLPTSAFNNRGLELRATGADPLGDAFSILGDSLTVELKADSPGDAIRVITGANPVPEPSALAALGLGAAGLLRRRRRA